MILKWYRTTNGRVLRKDNKNEWKNNSDIIKRQIEYLRENGADGFSVFSYNYVFGNKNFTKEEVKNLKSVI